jgi:hypothetical protein
VSGMPRVSMQTCFRDWQEGLEANSCGKQTAISSLSVNEIEIGYFTARIDQERMSRQARSGY